MQRTKYYDYHDGSIWRGIREFAPEALTMAFKAAQI